MFSLNQARSDVLELYEDFNAILNEFPFRVSFTLVVLLKTCSLASGHVLLRNSLMVVVVLYHLHRYECLSCAWKHSITWLHCVWVSTCSHFISGVLIGPDVIPRALLVFMMRAFCW